MVRFLPCSSWRFGNDFFEIKTKLATLKHRFYSKKITTLYIKL